MEIPAEEPGAQAAAPTAGEESGALSVTVTAPASPSEKKDDTQPLPEPRFFWISRLINELAKEQKVIEPEAIRKHLPQAIAAD